MQYNKHMTFKNDVIVHMVSEGLTLRFHRETDGDEGFSSGNTMKPLRSDESASCLNLQLELYYLLPFI